MKEKTVCFTGHRPQKLPWRFDESDERCVKMRANVKHEIEKAIDEGFCHFISGMALGFDMICAEIVLELKEKHPNIVLECVIPCRGQEKLWRQELQQRYWKIVGNADCSRCIYEKYVDGCMQVRNKYMIDLSSKVIALFDGVAGGTKQTLDYAQKQGLQIVVVKP